MGKLPDVSGPCAYLVAAQPTHCRPGGPRSQGSGEAPDRLSFHQAAERRHLRLSVFRPMSFSKKCGQVPISEGAVAVEGEGVRGGPVVVRSARSKDNPLVNLMRPRRGDSRDGLFADQRLEGGVDPNPDGFQTEKPRNITLERHLGKVDPPVPPGYGHRHGRIGPAPGPQRAIRLRPSGCSLAPSADTESRRTWQAFLSRGPWGDPRSQRLTRGGISAARTEPERWTVLG